MGCHAKHRLYQRKVANSSTHTKVCACAHNSICGSVLLCGGVHGSAASKQGEQETGRSDGGTDVQRDPAFANIDGGSVGGSVH